MASETRDTLMRQLDMAWRLTSVHLTGLTTDECLWRPAKAGLHVHPLDDGTWRADWPEHEGYEIGPPSIAWITWHIGYWWSIALDHSFGSASLSRNQVTWPGEADAVRQWLGDLRTRWIDAVGAMSEAELQAPERTRWPFANRPFGDVSAWVNLELTKNAAELGYARFLYAVSGKTAPAAP